MLIGYYVMTQLPTFFTFVKTIIIMYPVLILSIINNLISIGFEGVRFQVSHKTLAFLSKCEIRNKDMHAANFRDLF